jgi:hypothetical protein
MDVDKEWDQLFPNGNGEGNGKERKPKKNKIRI